MSNGCLESESIGKGENGEAGEIRRKSPSGEVGGEAPSMEVSAWAELASGGACPFSLRALPLCPVTSACPAGSWLRHHPPRGHFLAPPRMGSQRAFMTSWHPALTPITQYQDSDAVSNKAIAVFPELSLN